MFQMFKADRYRGKRVRLSAFIRTQDVTGHAALCFRVDGKPTAKRGQTLAFDNMDDRRILGTTDWTRYACVLDVPRDARAIFISNILAGRGNLYWADVRFEIVDKSVRVTGRGRAGSLALRPSNLDFSET